MPRQPSSPQPSSRSPLIAFKDLGESEVKKDPRPLCVYRILPEGRAAAPPGRSRRRGAAPERPALGLLPFQISAGSRDGILSRQRRRGFDYRIGALIGSPSWLAIQASNYKGNAADSKQIAWELGVPCVVEGILHEAGKPVRISCQLV